MKLIYPNFNNQYINDSNILNKIDEYRIEIIDSDVEEINSYVPHCSMALLEYTQYCDFPHEILTHDCYDDVQDFIEANNEFTFYCGGYNRRVPKHAEPIFYNLIKS